ncbi:MAG: hypothetical protein AAF732_01675 [Pseudomonadota bacterium]
MSGDVVSTEHYIFLALWLVGPVALFAYNSSHGRLPGVLVYAYIVGFFINHWMGALVHAAPNNEFTDSADTIVGFRLSTYGLVAFLIGALLAGRPDNDPVARTSSRRRFVWQLDELKILSAGGKLFLAIGALFWLLAETQIAFLPGAGAVIPAGKQYLLLGVGLLSWVAWRKGDLYKFRLWLAAGFILPPITVVTSGFIGYGISMLATILVFVAMFYRPRWLLLFGWLAAIYAGMSFWVAYHEHRTEIRRAVWGGQDYDARVDAILKVQESLVPFSISNQRHLDQIHLRLNQNSLVGAAVRVTPQYVPFQEGQTLLNALIAFIPRAVWPEKPTVGGSGNYVSMHTLIEFADGTSVGMGQVLEFYINFGVPAVLIGFVMLGYLLVRLDTALVGAMKKGNLGRLQFFFVIGTGALQPGGAMTEVVASMAGGAILAYLVSVYLEYGVKARPTRPDRKASTFSLNP